VRCLVFTTVVCVGRGHCFRWRAEQPSKRIGAWKKGQCANLGQNEKWGRRGDTKSVGSCIEFMRHVSRIYPNSVCSSCVDLVTFT
jgi:hypothetical protein